MRTLDFSNPDGSYRAFSLRRGFITMGRMRSIVSRIRGADVVNHPVEDTYEIRICTFSVRGVQFYLELAKGHIDYYRVVQESNGDPEVLSYVRQHFDSASPVSPIAILAVAVIAAIVIAFGVTT